MRPLTRRLTISLLCSTAALAAVIARPLPAGGFASDGCVLRLTALDTAGNPVAVVDSGTADASQERPLVVPWDGGLRWEAIRDGQPDPIAGPTSWHVEAYGLPTPVRGSDQRPASSGMISVSELLPFRISGLFHVSGEWSVAASTCRASGWLRITGDRFSTLPFCVALAFLLIGVVLLAVGARGSWEASIAAGALIAAGSLVLLVMYGALPFGARTPPAVVLFGILLGLLVGLAASRPARGTATRGTNPPDIVENDPR